MIYGKITPEAAEGGLLSALQNEPGVPEADGSIVLLGVENAVDVGHTADAAEERDRIGDRLDIDAQIGCSHVRARNRNVQEEESVLHPHFNSPDEITLVRIEDLIDSKAPCPCLGDRFRSHFNPQAVFPVSVVIDQEGFSVNLSKDSLTNVMMSIGKSHAFCVYSRTAHSISR
jgi:hypothetical protein